MKWSGQFKCERPCKFSTNIYYNISTSVHFLLQFSLSYLDNNMNKEIIYRVRVLFIVGQCEINNCALNKY